MRSRDERGSHSAAASVLGGVRRLAETALRARAYRVAQNRVSWPRLGAMLEVEWRCRAGARHDLVTVSLVGSEAFARRARRAHGDLGAHGAQRLLVVELDRQVLEPEATSRAAAPRRRSRPGWSPGLAAKFNATLRPVIVDARRGRRGTRARSFRSRCCRCCVDGSARARKEVGVALEPFSSNMWTVLLRAGARVRWAAGWALRIAREPLAGAPAGARRGRRTRSLVVESVTFGELLPQRAASGYHHCSAGGTVQLPRRAHHARKWTLGA